MATNQQYSTRIGVRKNLKALIVRLDLDMTTLNQISGLYAEAAPSVAEAARVACEACEILKALVEDIRENI